MVAVTSACQTDSGNTWLKKGMDVVQALDKNNISAAPNVGEIGDAFKQALSIGSANVVSQLGSADGFNADAAIHIPLPKKLDAVKKVLAKVCMTKVVDDLELKLNRAAEAATPMAKQLFMQSITDMTFDDVKTIYEGPEDSATTYFKGKMSPSLSKEMQPIVDNSLSKVGAVKALDKVMSTYKKIPFVPEVNINLTDHVVQKGMDGIFHYVAIEEAAIRKDPVKQTTALLKKVFGVK